MLTGSRDVVTTLKKSASQNPGPVRKVSILVLLLLAASDYTPDMDSAEAPLPTQQQVFTEEVVRRLR